jgi:sterol 24-C-methyltransferase
MTSLKLKDEVDGLQDATLSNVLHGNSAKAWGGITAMCKKDPGAQKAAVQEYFKHWDNTTAHEESQDTRQVRK